MSDPVILCLYEWQEPHRKAFLSQVLDKASFGRGSQQTQIMKRAFSDMDSIRLHQKRLYNVLQSLKV